jgi:hypothetical protein
MNAMKRIASALLAVVVAFSLALAQGSDPDAI